MQLTATNRSRAYPERSSGFGRRWISICGFEGALKENTSFKKEMHEWLSGGASPCQGEGRGFESRLVLFYFCPETLILSAFPGFCVSGKL